MTVISEKSSTDQITSADFNALVNKVQNQTDEDIAMSIVVANNVNKIPVIINQNDSTNNPKVASVTSSSTNVMWDLVSNGNGPHLRMSGDPTVAVPVDGDFWYDGSALNIRDSTTTVDLINAATNIWAHVDAETSKDVVYTRDTYGNITQTITYDGSTNVVQQDIYMASYKELLNMDDVNNWVETGDGALAQNAADFPDGTNVLRNTYTYSGGTSSMADATTNHGDISDWVGAGCTTGYVSVFAQFSDYTNITSIELRIGSSDANYRTVTLAKSTNWEANSKYWPLEFDLSGGSDEGTPDGSAVDYIALVITIASGTSKTIDFARMMLCKESTTKIGSEDFFDTRRITETYSRESKTLSYIYFYDDDNLLHTYTRGGGY